MVKTRHFANRLANLLTRYLHGESGLGILLVLAAALAMAMANSAWSDSYHHWFHGPLAWSPVSKLETVHLWINDGLMALFFFVVGLEIKREVLDGDLSRPQSRRLPVLAAFAGMAAPAAVFVLVAQSDPGLLRGWAIPAATDIAFALGVLAIIGRGLPPSLRLFLLSVAIVDDLGAVIVIALFYTAEISLAWLAAAAVVLMAMAALNRAGGERATPFVLLALALWYCVLHSGVHATIAGVLAALAIPLAVGKRTGDSLLLRLEHALAPFNGYVVVPVFGFANAGVDLRGLGTEAILAPLPLAVAAGLVVGKQAGIFGAIELAARTGLAPRPAGATTMQIWGIACLCGIGFTMSLFIGALAFPGDALLYDEAKIGVLAGTVISAVLGAIILRVSRPRGSR